MTLQLIAIKTKNKVFISDNIKNDSYFHTKLDGLIFDTGKLKPSYMKGWFEIDDIPTSIQKHKPKKKVNMRYELKEGYPVSELTPKVVSYSDFDDEYDDVRGLYTYKYDEVEEGIEEVEFEINVIAETEDDFNLERMDYKPVYNFLDRIQIHPLLLPTRPCVLTKEESYRIVRNFVKANIDPKYAKITSDYDFCFTVKKVFDLYKQEEYRVNINAMTKRKPKYETRYRRTREVTIFEVAPQARDGYPVIQEFVGKSYEDLVNNINTYLNDLIAKINEPVVECSCCGGFGVIFNGDN